MSVVDPAPLGSSLVDRAKDILLTPKAEWQKIALETTDIQKLYLGYAAPLVAFSAACGAIGLSVFGFGGYGVTYHVALIPALVGGVVRAVMGLAGLFVFGLLINALAPRFGSTQNPLQAHKVAVYSGTAGFLAGVFSLYPPLSPLSILGLYSFGLLYLGLPRLMGTPDNKRVGYYAVVLLSALVLSLLVSAVLAPMLMQHSPWNGSGAFQGPIGPGGHRPMMVPH
jgi:hypothetical protein